MLKKFKNPVFRIGMAVVLVAVGIGVAFLSASPAEAHCDSEKGPVATAAHEALLKNDVNLILPYVQADAEAELTAAFKETMAVRKMGKNAQTLADRYFVETAVRLHRAGEGAPYNGVTDEETPESILAADKAMNTGSTTELYALLDATMKKSIETRLHEVEAARANAEKLGTVEAHRERVEAELMFEKYIYELYTAAANTATLTEGHAH